MAHDREYLDIKTGGQKVTVKLAAILETIEALEDGEVGKALALLKTMAAAESRKELRQIREELYRRFRHAQLVGDDNEAENLRQLIRKCDQTRASLTA